MPSKTPHWTANKHLGQHFLVSEKVKQAIIATCPPSADAILEIGPGEGALTELLPSLQKPLFTIEIDERFIPHLHELMPPEQVIRQNALEVDYPSLLRPYAAWWVVSNMPYNIAAPLMRQLLPLTNVAGMTLMMQKEMAAKVLLLPPRKGINSLGLLLQNFWEVKKICAVDPTAFRPRPQVDSAVLFFTPRAHPLLPLAQLSAWEKFLRQIFAFRRKQIQLVLARMIQQADPTFAAKTVSQDLLAQVSLNPQVRAEALCAEQILALFQAWMAL